MNYYNEIKNKLIDNEIYSKIKDYSKERNRVLTYFEIGKLLFEAGTKYGEDIIGEYSKKLVIDVNKKYNSRTLRRYRQFYIIFKDIKWSTMSTILTWSHYAGLLPCDDIDKINYYISITKQNNLTIRELRNKIKSNEYERLSEDAKLINEDKLEIKDLVPNPIIIKNSNNYEVVSEKILQKIILEDIESFMKELGSSFCFISSEYKIKIGNNYNYIDLLLFNIEFNCYVVIKLKVTELKKEHIGQIEIYMNYIDKNIKKMYHDKTIGIIISRKDNKYLIEYCSDNRIISKEYQLLTTIN